MDTSPAAKRRRRPRISVSSRWGWGPSANAKKMIHILRTIAVLLAFATAAAAQSPDQHNLLQQIKAADTDQLAVSEEDGRLLRVMVVTRGAKRALEIGGATGYSAIWIGLGLRETGGHLTSIEYEPARARTEAENIRKAGLSDVVTVVPGDAFAQIPR